MIPGIHCGSCKTLSTICTNGEDFVSGDTYWCMVRGEEETLRLLEPQGVGAGAYDTPVSQLIRTAAGRTLDWLKACPGFPFSLG